MYDSLNFSKFADLCSHHHDPILKHFHFSQKTSLPGSSDSQFPLQLPSATDLPSVSITSFTEHSRKWRLFSAWPLSLAPFTRLRLLPPHRLLLCCFLSFYVPALHGGSWMSFHLLAGIALWTPYTSPRMQLFFHFSWVSSKSWVAPSPGNCFEALANFPRVDPAAVCTCSSGCQAFETLDLAIFSFFKAFVWCVL